MIHVWLNEWTSKPNHLEHKVYTMMTIAEFFIVLSLAYNSPRQMWVQATWVQIQVTACVPLQICSEPNPGLMNTVVHYQPLYNLLICNLSELIFSTLRAHTNNSIALLDKTTCSYILSWPSDCCFVDRTDRKSQSTKWRNWLHWQVYIRQNQWMREIHVFLPAEGPTSYSKPT